MNEKTKQILRYVACGLGGLALGIGLLGGLAMCASSGKSAKAESVNTILTKKNAVNTNPTSGITSYTFDIPSEQYILEQGTYRFKVYDVDTTDYDLTQVAMADSMAYIGAGFAVVTQAINNLYTNMMPSSQNVRFIAIEGYSEVEVGRLYFWTYFSFVSSHTPQLSLKPFILKSYAYPIWHLDSYKSANNASNEILINSAKSDHIIYKRTSANEEGFNYNFQDVASYYQSLGWSAGYESGETSGYNEGYTDGNNQGYSDGYDQGYEDGDNVGYWAGYNEGIGTASSFTDISGNLNAVYDLTTMGILSPTWQNLHGLTDVKIHTLLQFFDNDQNTWDCYIVDGVSSTQPTGTRTMYVDVAQLSSLDSQTIGFAVYSNASIVGLQEVGTAHFEFAQIRNVNNKSLANKLILLYGWTQNDVSYQAGYQAGLKDGFENTNTNNVFSLFTSAFNAVGGFFNLKIFGFLPLYWFFLTPLFVAIITLLLRMVKH